MKGWSNLPALLIFAAICAEWTKTKMMDEKTRQTRTVQYSEFIQCSEVNFSCGFGSLLKPDELVGEILVTHGTLQRYFNVCSIIISPAHR